MLFNLYNFRNANLSVFYKLTIKFYSFLFNVFLLEIYNQIMETKEQILKPIAYTFGLFLGLVIILSLIIEPFIAQKIIFSILSFSATLLVFITGIKKFKTKNANKISLVDTIKIGLAIAVIGALIAAIYTYVNLNYITEQTTSNNYNYAMLIIRTLSVGLIISLVTGLIVKNER